MNAVLKVDSVFRPEKELMYFRKKVDSSKRATDHLPIRGKIFEKLIFHAMYEFLNKNNLMRPKQSSSRPGDSTVNQLLSVTNEMHKAIDESSKETCPIFLDISKALDKVWYE